MKKVKAVLRRTYTEKNFNRGDDTHREPLIEAFLEELSALLTQEMIQQIEEHRMTALFQDWARNYKKLTARQRHQALLAGIDILPVAFTMWDPEKEQELVPESNVVSLHGAR